MENPSKNQVLASSRGWIATLLNFFPGLGAGYLYQRRWIPYFITTAIASSWFAAGAFLNDGEIQPTETEQLIGIGGLLLISITTMIEANLAYRKSIKEVKQQLYSKVKESKKRKGLFGR